MLDFTEFTEAGFGSLLRRLEAGGYRFACYGERPSGRHVLWRHDVDVSMHRAARLAEIEAERGVVATYFVNPRSGFYNLLEPEIEVLLRRIRSLGHEIGLHFDAGAYSIATLISDSLESVLRREHSFVENLLQSSIKAVSWHNPDGSNLLDYDVEEIAGMLNVYAGRLRRDYAYCSDSNGYWRFKLMVRLSARGTIGCISSPIRNVGHPRSRPNESIAAFWAELEKFARITMLSSIAVDGETDRC